MKPLSKTLFVAASICLITINSTTFAQGRFSKGGRSRISGGRGVSSSMRSGRSSSINRGALNGSSVNRGRTSVASPSTRSQFLRSGNQQTTVRKSLDQRLERSTGVVNVTRNSTRMQPGKRNGSPAPNVLKQWKNEQRRNGTIGRPRTTGTPGSRIANSPKKPLATNKFPKVNGKPFQTLPFKPGNLNNLRAGNQTHGNAQSKNEWRGIVRSLMQNNRNHWCHTRPAACHWWTQYCQPIAYCQQQEIIVCDWNRVVCRPIVHAGVAVQDVQWYLGMRGMLLPGKGIGIEAVEPGSPAELVGLQPGMVMTVCNGIPLIDEASMQEAIRISGGVLRMTLLSADGSQVLEGTAQMTRIAAVTF